MKLFVQFLGQGKAHKGIAEVDGQLGKRHFQIRTAGSDNTYAGSLSGGGNIGDRNCHGGRDRKPGTHRQDAESKGDGEIAQGNGNALENAFSKCFVQDDDVLSGACGQARIKCHSHNGTVTFIIP